MARSVEDRMSFMEHLGELRVRIVRALYALLVGSVPGLYFSQQIVDWLARPVTKLNYSLVFTSPAEALWVQMKVGLIVGLFIAAPGILWQVWAFIDRKSTRLNSSHGYISYAVFCLKKK